MQTLAFLCISVCVGFLAFRMPPPKHSLGGGGHRGEEQLLWLSILLFACPHPHIKEPEAGPLKLAQVQNTQHRPLNTRQSKAFEPWEILQGNRMPGQLFLDYDENPKQKHLIIMNMVTAELLETQDKNPIRISHGFRIYDPDI